MSLSASVDPAYRPALLLRRYFRSGWVFLIPYLFAYLLYAATEWPVNPGAASPGTVVGGIPSLLQVFGVLHLLHLLLAGIALASIWQGSRRDEVPAVSTVSARGLLPWILLGLFFLLPGLYLEWPSDPWEHLRRINEWRAHTLVTEHTTWEKSAYFLPYSLTFLARGPAQLSLLHFYYVGVCLLLSWQYYRLARAAGLDTRLSTLVVILQALFMGNNIFSFYRYYGLSSTLFAQLGAVALIRIVLERLAPHDAPASAARLGERKISWPSTLAPGFSLPKTIVSGTGVVGLLVLIYYNHRQGLGIAGLGVLAVVCWRLVAWRRSMLGVLVIGALLASVAAVLWYPQYASVDEYLRPVGWLNSWYGFNLLAPGSPAFDRAAQIVGISGLIDLLAALWLIRRNHVVGWLTLTPLVALLLPCFSLPLVRVIAADPNFLNIITFHRLFFAIPVGLAVVTVGKQFLLPQPSRGRTSVGSGQDGTFPRGLRDTFLFPLGLVLLVVILPPGQFFYNRLWHSTQTTPGDLSLGQYVAVWNAENLARAREASTLGVSAPLGGQIQEAFDPSLDWTRLKRTAVYSMPADVERQVRQLSDQWAATAPLGEEQEGADRLSVRDATLVETLLSDENSGWSALAGEQPVIDSTPDGVTIGNPTGAVSYPFTDTLLPVAPWQRYRLTITARKEAGPVSENYLAVAWYDAAGQVLPSNLPAPAGASHPAGWANGTYSYFGLKGQDAPGEWTTYSVEFGGDAYHPAIPAQAAAMRIGALLNFRGDPDVQVEIRRVSLWENTGYDQFLFAVPDPRNLFSPESLAARLSGHWLPVKVSLDQVGLREVRAFTQTWGNEAPGVPLSPSE